MADFYEDNPTQLIRDANAFAGSRFGKHYLKRLHEAQERELKAVMSRNTSSDERTHAGGAMAMAQAELDYFATARNVQETPSLMQRLRDSVNKRKENKPKV